MSPLMTAFLYGVGIGVVVSVVGALLSYWFGLRRNDTETKTPLILLMLSMLGLGAVGVAVLVAAGGAGRIAAALLTGVGVVLGFSAVFAVLLAVWVRTDHD